MRTDGLTRNASTAYNPKMFRKECSELLRSDDDDDDDHGFDSDEEYGPHWGGRLKRHIVPFTDHTGQTAYMVFKNLEAVPLPPLFSFPIYFTHPDVSMEQVDMVGLYGELTTAFSSLVDFRLDMYCLPGADQDACINHYHHEKSVRGSFEAQPRTFQAYRRDRVRRDAQLPGMVNNYRQYGTRRSVLFICPDRDWREGERILRHVGFDYRRRDDLPSVIPRDVFMNERSQGYGRLGPNALDQADETMYYFAHSDRELVDGPWQMVRSWGWTSW